MDVMLGWMAFCDILYGKSQLISEAEKKEWEEKERKREAIYEKVSSLDYKITLTGKEILSLINRGCSCCYQDGESEIDLKIKSQLPKELQ